MRKKEVQIAIEKTQLEMKSATRDRREEAVRNLQLDAENKSKNSKCEQLQIELDKLQSEKSLETKLDLLQADLNASKALVNQLTLIYTEQLRKSSQLQEKLEELQGNVNRLTMRVMQDELSQARGDYETERHRANLNERDATSAHTQAAKLRVQVAAQLSAKLGPLQNERSALKQQVNFLSVCTT